MGPCRVGNLFGNKLGRNGLTRRQNLVKWVMLGCLNDPYFSSFDILRPKLVWGLKTQTVVMLSSLLLFSLSSVGSLISRWNSLCALLSSFIIAFDVSDQIEASVLFSLVTALNACASKSYK